MRTVSHDTSDNDTTPPETSADTITHVPLVRTNQHDTVSISNATDKIDCFSLADSEDCERNTQLVNESHQELNSVVDVDTTS